MMQSLTGASLIEVVIFIAVISIALTGITLVMSTVLLQSPIAEQTSQALSLAQGRMELILGQRHYNGYVGLQDPCSSTSPPAICSQTLPNLVVQSTITPTIINTDNHYSIVTVTVTNAQNTSDVRAVLKSLVANF